MEAELLYKQCVSDAKIHQDELVKVKERIISHIRKLICQGDTVLKEVGMIEKTNICLSISTYSKTQKFGHIFIPLNDKVCQNV